MIDILIFTIMMEPKFDIDDTAEKGHSFPKALIFRERSLLVGLEHSWTRSFVFERGSLLRK